MEIYISEPFEFTTKAGKDKTYGFNALFNSEGQPTQVNGFRVGPKGILPPAIRSGSYQYFPAVLLNGDAALALYDKLVTVSPVIEKLLTVRRETAVQEIKATEILADKFGIQIS